MLLLEMLTLETASRLSHCPLPCRQSALDSFQTCYIPFTNQRSLEPCSLGCKVVGNTFLCRLVQQAKLWEDMSPPWGAGAFIHSSSQQTRPLRFYHRILWTFIDHKCLGLFLLTICQHRESLEGENTLRTYI